MLVTAVFFSLDTDYMRFILTFDMQLIATPSEDAVSVAFSLPLLGRADTATDCGTAPDSPNRCVFYTGQRYYHIGRTARANGIGA